MDFSPDQEKALIAIRSWYESWTPDCNRPYFYLGGYAGCGKTTIEGHFTNSVPGRVVRAAFTGKAALRMQQVSGKQASTVHSVAYKIMGEDTDPDTKGPRQPVFERNTTDSPLLNCNLLVLDECSMINDEMAKDLLLFKVPILVLGDPGQLPPVSGAGFFTKRRPDAMLTEVHRQALDSPIIRVATAIRDGKPIGRLTEGEVRVYPFSKEYDYEQELLMAEQILTGTNIVRNNTNFKIRTLQGYMQQNGYLPVVDDKLICLKNERKLNIFNGLMGKVSQVHFQNDEEVLLDLDSEIGPRKRLRILPECFTDPEAVAAASYKQKVEYSEFDYGYCITVHKSQGSQWNDVLIIDDNHLSWKKEARAQWLYTAVTRAVEKLTVLRR